MDFEDLASFLFPAMDAESAEMKNRLEGYVGVNKEPKKITLNTTKTKINKVIPRVCSHPHRVGIIIFRENTPQQANFHKKPQSQNKNKRRMSHQQKIGNGRNLYENLQSI